MEETLANPANCLEWVGELASAMAMVTAGSELIGGAVLEDGRKEGLITSEGVRESCWVAYGDGLGRFGTHRCGLGS